MIGHKQISSGFVSFATNRLLDLSRAYLTGYDITPSFTDIPISTVKTIAWFKFDRLSNLGYEYVRRCELEELIRIDSDLLNQIIGEIASTIPYSDENRPGERNNNIGHSHPAYKDHIYDCMNAVIATVVSDMRNGRTDRKSVVSILHIPSEVVWSLAALHSDHCWRVAKIYAERISFNDFYLLDLPLLTNLVEISIVAARQQEKLEKYILLGASQCHIKIIFGASVRNTTIAELKRYLKFSGRQEDLESTRHSKMNKQQRDFLYDVWIENLHLSLKDRYIAVSEQTRVRICAIHNVVAELEPCADEKCA
jgi:hypothetical protein